LRQLKGRSQTTQTLVGKVDLENFALDGFDLDLDGFDWELRE
jgi:hypothetical protein